MSELKPCPKCGEMPKMEYSDDYGFPSSERHFRYACQRCGISGEPFSYLVDAIDAWNRRVGEGEKG